MKNLILTMVLAALSAVSFGQVEKDIDYLKEEITSINAKFDQHSILFTVGQTVSAVGGIVAFVGSKSTNISTELQNTGIFFIVIGSITTAISHINFHPNHRTGNGITSVLYESKVCDTIYLNSGCGMDYNDNGMIDIGDLVFGFLPQLGNFTDCIGGGIPADQSLYDMEDHTYTPSSRNYIESDGTYTLLRTVDINGRDVQWDYTGIVFYIYSDGVVEKRFQTNQ